MVVFDDTFHKIHDRGSPGMKKYIKLFVDVNIS